MSEPGWPRIAPASSRSGRTFTSASASWPRPAATPILDGSGSSASAPPTTTSRSSAPEREPRSSASTDWAAPSLRSYRRSRRSRRRDSESSRWICPDSATRTSRTPGRYDAPWFARAVIELLDELEIERAHLAGNSMGGRIAIETGLLHADRVERMVLLSPALAWLKDRGWKWLLRTAAASTRLHPAHAPARRRADRPQARPRRE